MGESVADGIARLRALNEAERRPTRVTAPWALALLATACAGGANRPANGVTWPVEARTRQPGTVAARSHREAV
jgi:hypothetical protein